MGVSSTFLGASTSVLAVLGPLPLAFRQPEAAEDIVRLTSAKSTGMSWQGWNKGIEGVYVCLLADKQQGLGNSLGFPRLYQTHGYTVAYLILNVPHTYISISYICLCKISFPVSHLALSSGLLRRVSPISLTLNTLWRG